MNVCRFLWSCSITALNNDWKEFLELPNSRGVDLADLAALEA